jgi:methylglutaconyl-CoA hydratase
MEGSVNHTLSKGVATITFYHPQSNSLPGNILTELVEKITFLGDHKEARVIVLKSEGDRAFCAGASFDELMAIENKESGEIFFMGFANVINAMRKCPKLIIGRVQGKAVGGGVGMASAVDYCLATKYAAVKLSELAIGIGPFVVGPAVERKLGLSGMSQLAINATAWKSAQWAMEKGLYQDVFENIEELDQAVDDLALTLAESNPEAMFELKQNFWQDCEHWDELLAERAAISGKLVLSEFTREAIQKFKGSKSG